MNEQALLQGMADIDLPPAPDWQPWLLTLIALIMLAASALLLWRRRRKAVPLPAVGDHCAEHSAIEVLRALRQRWRGGDIDTRETAYRIATVLRRGLMLRRLQPQAPPATVSAAEWQALLAHLAALRYRPQCNAAIDETLFARIEAILAPDAERARTAGDAP